jgi:hypothetical protein
MPRSASSARISAAQCHSGRISWRVSAYSSVSDCGRGTWPDSIRYTVTVRAVVLSLPPLQANTQSGYRSP